MSTIHGITTPKPGREPVVQNEEVSVAEWEALSKTLRELHRVLLAVARKDYERDHGPIANPAHFLKLLTGNEHFAWLRPLSKLMADIDHIHGLDTGSRNEIAKSVRAAVEGLIAPAGATPAEVFAASYLPMLADQPEVAMAHAAVKQAARRWPAPDQVEGAGKLLERVAEMAKRRRAPGS